MMVLVRGCLSCMLFYTGKKEHGNADEYDNLKTLRQLFYELKSQFKTILDKMFPFD